MGNGRQTIGLVVEIFLSYANEDKEIAEFVYVALLGAGHNVFFDSKSLKPGSDYNSCIRNAIEKCDCYIYLVSNNSIGQGRYIHSELELVKNKWPNPYGHVLPVLIDSNDCRGKLDAYLSSVTPLVVRGHAAAEVAAAVAKLPLPVSRGTGTECLRSEPAYSEEHTLLVEVADRLLYYCELKGWTSQELLKNTSNAVRSLRNRTGKDYRRVSITLDTIDDLFKRRTPALSFEIVKILSEAVEITCDDLLGKQMRMAQTLEPCASEYLFLDPFADPIISALVKNLLGDYERNAGTLIGWADFLPCSLETPEFMEAHHQARYRSYPAGARNALIVTFNRIGNKRREWVHSEERMKSSSFITMMFKSALERIAKGRNEYKYIEPKLRRECLSFVRETVADTNNKIELIVADDDGAEGLKDRLKGFDSILVFGNLFTFWRSPDGTIFHSANEHHINRHISLLSSLRQLSTQDDRQNVLKFLDGLIKGMQT